MKKLRIAMGLRLTKKNSGVGKEKGLLSVYRSRAVALQKVQLETTVRLGYAVNAAATQGTPMANKEHVSRLRAGVAPWNQWREENPAALPDLSGADLAGADLCHANLSTAKLTGADLTGARCCRANFDDADLSNAAGRGALFTGASFVGTCLADTRLTECEFGSINALNWSSLERTDLRALLAHCAGAVMTLALVIGACTTETVQERLDPILVCELGALWAGVVIANGFYRSRHHSRSLQQVASGMLFLGCGTLWAWAFSFVPVACLVLWNISRGKPYYESGGLVFTNYFFLVLTMVLYRGLRLAISSATDHESIGLHRRFRFSAVLALSITTLFVGTGLAFDVEIRWAACLVGSVFGIYVHAAYQALDRTCAAQFLGCTMTGADFTGSSFRDAQIAADHRGSVAIDESDPRHEIGDFPVMEIKNHRVSLADSRYVIAVPPTIRNTNFSQADLRDCRIHEAVLDRLQLDRTKLQACYLSDVAVFNIDVNALSLPEGRGKNIDLRWANTDAPCPSESGSYTNVIRNNEEFVDAVASKWTTLCLYYPFVSWAHTRDIRSADAFKAFLATYENLAAFTITTSSIIEHLSTARSDEKQHDPA